MSTPELQQRLALLDAAIQSGEKTIQSPNGGSVTYRSLDEMKEARRDIVAQLSPVRRRKAVTMRATFTTLRGG